MDIAAIVIYAVLTVVLMLLALEIRDRLRRSRHPRASATTRLEATGQQLPPTLTEPTRPAPLPIFSQREWEIAQLAASGKTNKEIAGLVGLSPNTVGTHIKKIYRKLDVSNRAELSSRLQQLTSNHQ